MARRKLLSTTTRQMLFALPYDIASLEKHYVFAQDDLHLIATRRGSENKLGLASLTQELAMTDPDTPEYQEILAAMQDIKRIIFAKRRFSLR